MTTTLETPIALEICIPESLFRRLQQVLDTSPAQSFDELTILALSAYLFHLNTLDSQ